MNMCDNDKNRRGILHQQALFLIITISPLRKILHIACSDIGYAPRWKNIWKNMLIYDCTYRLHVESSGLGHESGLGLVFIMDYCLYNHYVNIADFIKLIPRCGQFYESHPWIKEKQPYYLVGSCGFCPPPRHQTDRNLPRTNGVGVALAYGAYATVYRSEYPHSIQRIPCY